MKMTSTQKVLAYKKNYCSWLKATFRDIACNRATGLSSWSMFVFLTPKQGLANRRGSVKVK